MTVSAGPVCARCAVIAVAAVAAGVGLWCAIPDAQTVTPGESKPVALPGPDADDAAQPIAAATSPQPRHAVEARLRVRVVDDAGRPVSGEILWVSSAEPPCPGALLRPEAGPLPAQARCMSYVGEVELRVPTGAWIWLRATDVGHPGLGAYARVAPSEHGQELTLRIDPRSRVLHVFVLRPDMGGPQGEADVELSSLELRGRGARTPCGSARTDRFGYARLDGLRPGSFVVASASARAHVSPPFAQSVLMPTGMPVRELPVVVVARAATQAVRLKVSATSVPLGGLAPKPYFQNVESGELLPFPDTMRAGDHDHEVDVPPGDYMLGILPLGAMELVPEEAVYAVREGVEAAFEVRARTAGARVEVRLSGLTRRDLPVSVRPRRVGYVVAGDRSALFWGPHRWRLLEQEVPALALEGFVVVESKAACWISAQPWRLDRDVPEPGLIPATALRLRWRPAQWEDGADALIEVESGVGTETLRLQPRVGRSGDGAPAYTGTIVVPRGAVRLTCLTATGGRAWHREISADQARQIVRIE